MTVTEAMGNEILTFYDLLHSHPERKRLKLASELSRSSYISQPSNGDGEEMSFFITVNLENEQRKRQTQEECTEAQSAGMHVGGGPAWNTPVHPACHP